MSSWASFGAYRMSALDVISPSSSDALLDQARARLDEEIEAVFATVAAIRTRRNSLSPIARLHPEILAHVFAFLAADPEEIPMRRSYHSVYDDPKLGRGANPYHSHGWIRVTHVCRKWRHTALDNPGLWGIDVCSFPAWTEERLRRSKRAPIDATFEFTGRHGRTPNNDKFAEVILIALDRTRELALDGFDPRCMGDVSRPLLRPAPLLESFTCSCAPTLVDFDGFRRCLPRLPSRLFEGKAPRLRKLSLTDVLIPLDSPLYKNLVDLSLLSDPYLGLLSFNFTRDQLLGLFSGMSNLQSLEIRHMVPQNDTKDPSTSSGASSANPHGRVSLPRLQKLKITGDAQDCIWISQSLSIPPSATFQMDCRSEQLTRLDALRSLLAFAAPHTQGDGSIAPIVCLSIRILPECLHFGGWRTYPDHLFTMRDSYIVSFKEPEISVDFKALDIVPVELYQILQDVCEGFCHDNIAALDISTTTLPVFPGSEYEFNWSKFFGRLTAVEQIAAGGSVVGPLISKLFQNPFYSNPKGLEPNPEQWLFPSLRRLKFSRVNFWNFREDEEEESCTELIEMLRQAQECPATNIEELLLQDCGIDESSMEHLRRVVPLVSWDDRQQSAPWLSQDNDLFGQAQAEREEEEGEGEEETEITAEAVEELFGGWGDEPILAGENLVPVNVQDILLALGLR
ncbi:hypothetical protein EVG20_g1631 [Dentipellis fragilis]|uniref:Uncharacterized protein n=1 Tax=Dentipellis fragilis TaxID=205917 RepID=A0A4Y9ZC39_9AGAM|nr:hypothetical protein EVG20_g1631 [Dentipellis fragilis]